MNRAARVASLEKGVRVADQWWSDRFADLVERRFPKVRPGPYVYAAPKKRPTRPVPTSVETAPPPLPRPEDMPRQMHRRLYRQACKTAGMRRPQGR